MAGELPGGDVNHSIPQPEISVVIPSYQRTEILLNTIQQLLAQIVKASEIVVVDQTPYDAGDKGYEELCKLAQSDQITFIQRAIPSIPASMNEGLISAGSEFVLFLDDDIEINPDFILRHQEGLIEAENQTGQAVVAQVGQVLQPGETVITRSAGLSGYGLTRDVSFPFNSEGSAWIWNCMAGNLCVHRSTAISAGGFDERFTGAAYRFETEFARRLIRHSGRSIHYWPAARIHHLQWSVGGTRSHASHLTSPAPIHSIGDYYYALRESSGSTALSYVLRRLSTSFIAKFYLTRPWFIPLRLIGELRGLVGAIGLAKSDPLLISNRPDKSTSSTRLVAVMSHPTQHFVPVYRALAKDAKLNFQVLFLADNGTVETFDPGFDQAVGWDRSMTEGYNHEFLEPRRTLEKFGFFNMYHPSLVSALSDLDPEVIWLHGYGQYANWRVRRKYGARAKIIYSSDSNSKAIRGTLKKIAKRLIVPRFLKSCDRLLAVSDSNEEYLKYYGAKDRDIVRVPFPIDMSFWNSASVIEQQENRHQLREELGIGRDETVYLFAGKLQAHKAPADVIRAFAELNQTNTYLLIAGSGEESQKLKLLADQEGVSERVKFLGFLNQGELPNVFICSDVLVFPSVIEPYGAIAAEVLPFGLAIIASDMIGAIGGPIQPGQNALVYPASDIQGLADCMVELHRNRSQRRLFSDHSRRIADTQDASLMAAAISEFSQSNQK